MKIHWVALGGTIQAVGRSPLDLDRYWECGTSEAAELMAGAVCNLIGGRRAGLELIAEQHHSQASHQAGVEDVVALCVHLDELCRLDPEVTGIVVSTGSNGMEELAYLLWLMYDGNVPVMVTAAMRPLTAIGSDALPNLLDAVVVASSQWVEGATVLVVSDGALLHPAHSAKQDTRRLDSFRSSAMPLGTVRPGENPVMVSALPEVGPLGGVHRRWLPCGGPTALPRVEIVISYLGADGMAVRWATEGGASAMVSAGMGAGFVTDAESEALLDAHASGVIVCQSRRTPNGPVTPQRREFLNAGSLTPQKARLALVVGLAAGLEPTRLQAVLKVSSMESAGR